MRELLRLSLLFICLHFLASFVAVILFDGSVRNDIDIGLFEPSLASQRLALAVKIAIFPLGILADSRMFSGGIHKVSIAILVANSTAWGFIFAKLYTLLLPMLATHKQRKDGSARRKPFLFSAFTQKVFWLCLIHFLATYTLHVLEVAERMGNVTDSAVIGIARLFRYPITPLLFPDSLWQSENILITERFWLILPNSLIWGFLAAVLIGIASIGRK